MKKKHHTPEQIITKLRAVERLTAEGATVKEAVKQIEVSEQTYYRWRREYGGMQKNQLKQLKELQKENARLKKLLAEKELDALFAARGAPGNVRSDNGPEFMAEAVKTHLRDLDVDTRYIEPGAPWQNGFIESTGSRLRDELLDRELFTTRLEAQVLCERYRRFYNEERPHSALDYQTPVAFAAGLEQNITLEPALALT